MHEVSIMQSTLEIALERAAREHARRITALHLRIGALSGVVKEALEFAFDVVTADTLAQGASLTIDTVPVVCYCQKCQSEFQPPDPFYECPNCGQLSHQLLRGTEMDLLSIEIQT